MNTKTTAHIVQPYLYLPLLSYEVDAFVRTHKAKKVVSKTDFLYRSLLSSYIGYQEHKKADSLEDVLATSFSASTLAKNLGGNNRDPATGEMAYKKYLKPFWRFEESNSGYSKDKQETKRYYLRPEAIQLIEASLAGGGEVRCADSNRKLEAADLPTNGIIRTSYSTLHLPPLISLNRAEVVRRMLELEEEVSNLSPLHIAQRHRIPRLTLALRQVKVGLAYHDAIGGIPNFYSDIKSLTSSGRLSSVGAFHLQSIRREARKILLSGLGLWDYDFASCSQAILVSLARAADLPADVTKDYIQSKKAHFARLQKRVGTDEATIKDAFIALLYGARITPHEEGALGSAMGYEGAERFLSDSFVQDYIVELAVLKNGLLKWSEGASSPERWSPDGLQNCVGKTKPLWQTPPKKAKQQQTPKKTKTPDHELLYHLIMGYEAWALNAVLNGERPTVLVFDGWMGEELDTVVLEAKIREASQAEFGFPLVMKLKGEPL